MIWEFKFYECKEVQAAKATNELFDKIINAIDVERNIYLAMVIVT